MRSLLLIVAALLGAVWASSATAQHPDAILTGKAAFGDWRGDAPGVKRLIRPEDIPLAYETASASNSVRSVARKPDQKPIVPRGFEAELVAEGLNQPRILRVAPNGDLFVAESGAGRVRVLRGLDGGTPTSEVFASGLNRPFGIAFYPPGDQPEWVYVANTDSIVRFPYRNGDTKAGSRAELMAKLPAGGHWTRDIVFSPDGTRMFVSVGSASNVADSIGRLNPTALEAWASAHPPGAAWGYEADRAAVLTFTPNGTPTGLFATGIRNCVSMAIAPGSGDLWCATNERDGLGDDVPPDYLTRVREGAFYGWPWFYIGGNEDPRHRGARPDLKTKVTLPDVLVQPHSAPLGMAFYEGTQFPAEYRGSAFAALHGSWNRAKRTGYKIIRTLINKDGSPTGGYEDFATGFAVDDNNVWGRPVGVAIARDGALLISEDASGTIWRIVYRGRAARN